MATNSFELFVAQRYLRAKRKQAVISVITVISVAGVAAGVMALVIGIAINNGFRNTLQQSLLGANAHVMVVEKQPSSGIQNWQELAPKFRQVPHVLSATPGLYVPVMLTAAQSSGAELKGIPLERPPDILLHLKQGSFERLRDAKGFPGIVVGARLSESTGAILGSVVKIINPQGELTPFGPQPTVTRFRVVGIFESGFYDVDNALMFTSLKSAQIVLGEMGNVVNSIELRLDDIYKAPDVAHAAERITGPALVANTWMEQYHQILSALNMEKIVTAVTIGLIQLVAGLNILIALVMMVMEKNRDVAVLMAMGAKHQQIRRIFMVQGLLIGVVGTVIGLILGYSLSFLADHYRWLRLDQEVYAVGYVPFNARWLDGLWIGATAIFVSFVATIYPARSATRIAPAEALRYE